jgi:hypothetical protein
MWRLQLDGTHESRWMLASVSVLQARVMYDHLCWCFTLLLFLLELLLLLRALMNYIRLSHSSPGSCASTYHIALSIAVQY